MPAGASNAQTTWTMVVLAKASAERLTKDPILSLPLWYQPVL
jgi:hypothetical protein